MKAPFGYLLYRECVMSLKYMKSSITGSVGTIIAFLLFRLSLKYGNLALLFADDSESMAVASPIFLGLDFTPVVMLATMLMCLAESSQHETATVWRRFRISLPVSAWKYTLAKSVFIAIVLVIAIAVGTGYMAVSCSLSGTVFDEKIIGAILFVFAIMFVFTMLMKALVYILGSIEKAGIASSVIMLFVVSPIMFRADRDEAPGMQNFAAMFDKAGELLPILVLILIAMLGLDYVITALLLKRRER